MNYGKRPPLDEQKSLWEATLAAEGVTTSAGEGTGLSLIDAGLAGAGANSFISMMAVIYPGQPMLVDSKDITAFNNGTGEVTVASAFKGGQVPTGVPYKIVTFRFVPAEVAALTADVAALETKVERIDYYDRIFFDHLRGVAGAAYPIGTPQLPCSSIDDVITLCTARNIKVIDVWGILTLNAAREGFTFIGHRREDPAVSFDLGGQSVDGSIIRGCIITGIQGGVGFLTLDDCLVYLLTDFQGIANYCDLYGSAMSLRDGGYQDLHHCNSVHSDLTITVNAPTRASFKECSGNCTFTAQDGGVLYVRGYKGTLVIDLMTGGTCDIYANGADITINANCTGGTINIYGDARVTDNSGAGCTVNNYTIQATGGALALTTFTQETTGAIGANGTSWVDLLDKSTLTKPTKIYGFKVTMGGTPWAGNLCVRIVDGAGTTKIFPFQAEYVEGTDFTDVTQAVFNFPVVVPVANGYKFQFRSTNAGDTGGGGQTLTLNNLDVIEVG